jgi:hypothetical protein
MADSNTVHIGENSPQQVAYKLMKDIAQSEGFYLGQTTIRPDREWIIKTYCSCLMAVTQPGYPKDALSLLPDKQG